MDDYTLDALNREALESHDRAAEQGPDDSDDREGWATDEERDLGTFLRAPETDRP